MCDFSILKLSLAKLTSESVGDVRSGTMYLFSVHLEALIRFSTDSWLHLPILWKT